MYFIKDWLETVSRVVFFVVIFFFKLCVFL